MTDQAPDHVDWFGTSMTPLAGGYSGETFLVGNDGASQQEVVLRIYRRNPERAMIDASLLRLVRGIVPVPEVVEARPAHAGQPGILITEMLSGTPLDQVLNDPPDSLDWEVLGINLGWVLGSLSHIPFLRFGMFVDAELSLSAESAPAGDLVEWAQRFRDTGRLAAWSERDWHALLSLLDQAEEVLAEDTALHPPRAVLSHSDFNPKNLLIDPASCGILGLVDWEFAHAGSIHTDFGNFTRFERDERLVDPLIEGFVDSAPGQIRNPVLHGRAMDLWALIELAGHERSNAVRELATELLLAQARAGDLEAWPWNEPYRHPTVTR